MDITSFIISLISGAIGGNATGAALKDQSLGALGNTVAGLVGGVAGTYILQAVGILNTLGLGGMTLGSFFGNAGSGLVSGAILTGIIGFIKNAISKKP